MADSEQRVAPAVSTPPEPQSVGRILKDARAARDLSLEQVSAELRIEAQQLDALEQDRFDRIGVPVFVKGYLRQYAARLGLDVPDLLLKYYKQTSLQEIQIQPSKTIRLRDERQITVWIVALLILAVLVVAFAVWWLNGGGFGLGPGASTPAALTSTGPPTGLPAAAVASVPAPTTPTSLPNAARAAPEITSVAAMVVSSAASSPRAPAEVASAAPDAAAAATAATPMADLSPTRRGAAQDDEPAVARTGGSVAAELQVVFEQDSWAEISDARGERLFYGLGAAGRNANLSGEPPFAVVLGNAAGVRIALEGADFPVPTDGKPGDYARFSVDVAAE